MNLTSENVRQFIQRYRKQLAIAAGAGLATLTVGMVATAYLIYMSATFVTKTPWQPQANEALKQLNPSAHGYVEELVLDVASRWFQHRALITNVNQVKHALQCFDALGGPSSEKILNHVQGKIADAKLQEHLNSLSTLLADQDATKGPSACVDWALNS